MQVFSIDDIEKGELVGAPTATTIEFIFKGKKASVEVLIKPLPFEQTDKYLSALQRGDDILPVWIAAALIDSAGKPRFTADDVRKKFNQTLVNATYAKLMGELSLQTEEIATSEVDGDGDPVGKQES